MDALNLKIGLYDSPEQQTQDHYAIDLYRSNFAIFGSSMSGKTTLLKTLLIRIHQVCALTSKEEIYILDFGSNLSEFKRLPYVVACFDATHEENIRRIFNRVENRLSENIKMLKGKSYLQSKVEDRPAHITFIIDGLNSFMGEDRYNVYHDSLQRLSRDGLSKGLSIVFTANESTGGVHKLLPSFKCIAAFDLPKDTYMEIFGHRVEKPMPIKGRGVVNSEDGIYEFQAYLPYNINDLSCSDISEIDKIISELVNRFCKSIEDGGYIDTATAQSNVKILLSCANKKMKNFTDDLTKDNWKDYTSMTWDEYRTSGMCKGTEMVAGLDYYTLEPVKIDLNRTRSIAIYGKKSSGKTNLLSLVLEIASNISGVKFVVLEDARGGVEDPKKASAIASILSRASYVEYLHSPDEFVEYLKTEGYYDVPKSMSPTYGIEDTVLNDSDGTSNSFSEKTHPFTVFVIQSRLFYQTSAGGPNEQLIHRIDQFVCNESTTNKKLFIFSDVQMIPDDFNVTIFNNWIDHAFLLDDIVRFVGNPRGQKSVFGSQDIAELKEQFGKCELGDGFYLNLELVELTKLKFIKQEE